MVQGVPYMRPSDIRHMPGGGAQSPADALQQGMQFGQTIRAEIDRKKTQRKLDKLFTSLGDEPPNQQQFIALSKMIGPEFATELLGYHSTMSGLRADERKAALDDVMMGMEIAGSVTDTLRNVPVEGRMEAFTQMLTPLAQDERFKPYIRPTIEMFQDGNFDDERLDIMSSLAFSFGRYQTVMDNRFKREGEAADRDLAAEEEANRAAEAAAEQAEEARQFDIEAGFKETEAEAKLITAKAALLKAQKGETKKEGLTGAELNAEVEKMVSEWGGDRGSWYVFLRKDGEKFLKQSDDGLWTVGGTDKQLNLGRFMEEEVMLGPGEMDLPAEGSVQDLIDEGMFQ